MINIRKKIDDFGKLEAAVTFSDELTPQGKTKELQRIQAEVLAFRKDALQELGAAWRDLRARYKVLATAQAKADDEAGARWDYVRLAYMRGTVENAGKTAKSRQEFFNRMTKEINSGDIHAARAWAEFAPSIDRDRFGEKGNSDIAQIAKKALDELLTTPALAKAKADGEAWVRDTLNVYEETQRAAKFYGGRYLGGAITDDFDKLTEGVHLNQNFDPLTGTSTSITID